MINRKLTSYLPPELWGNIFSYRDNRADVVQAASLLKADIYGAYLQNIQRMPDDAFLKKIYKKLTVGIDNDLSTKELVKKVLSTAERLLNKAQSILKLPDGCPYHKTHLLIPEEMNRMAQTISKKRNKNLVQGFERLQRRRFFHGLPLLVGTWREKAAHIRQWLSENEIALDRQSIHQDMEYFLSDFSSIPKELLLFANLDPDTETQFFVEAATKGDVEFVTAFISTPNFGAVDPLYLGFALISAAQSDAFEILKLLVHSGRIHEIAGVVLVSALNYFIGHKNREGVQMLLTHLSSEPVQLDNSFLLRGGITKHDLKYLIRQAHDAPEIAQLLSAALAQNKYCSVVP